MTNRSTKAELDQRITDIQMLILDGHTRSHILQFGSVWKISERQIDDYIKTATDRIKESNKVSVQENLSIVTAQLWSLFRQARAVSNISEQRQILMSLAKLKGLDQQKLKPEIELTGLEHLSDEELDAL